jgi:hypothetical protein
MARPLVTDRTKARLRRQVERLPQRAVAFRRGKTTLDPQLVYLAPVSTESRERMSGGGQARRVDTRLYGALDADIRVGDRCTITGAPMEVIFLDTLSDVFVYAELEVTR